MSNFWKSNQNPSSLSESELSKLDSAMRENNRFAEKLREKSRKKGYTEANQTPYSLAKIGYLAICLFYVAVAWPWLAGIVADHFSYLDPFLAKLFGGTIAVCGLAVIEWLRIRNATALLENHYFFQEFGGQRLAYAAVFTIITATMAILGVPDMIDTVHPAPTPLVATEKTQSLIDASYQPQIAAADRAAAEFKESRSWLGKLSDPDGKRYTKMLNTASTLRRDYSEALKNLGAENTKLRTDTELLNQKTAADHASQKKGIARTLGFFIVILEGLFWFCFTFKEKFEYYAYLEMHAAAKNQAAPQQQKPAAAPPPPPAQMKQAEIAQLLEAAKTKALEKINEERKINPNLAVNLDMVAKEMLLAATHNGSYASLPLGGGGK